MKATTRRYATWQSVCFVLAAVVGCSDDPTQIQVVIEADDDVIALTSELQVSVAAAASRGEAFTNASRSVLQLQVGAGDWPVRHTVVPANEDANRVFEIVVGAIDGGGSRIAQVRAQTGFVEEQTRTLKLRLEGGGCLQATCDETETCEAGACVPVTFKEPTELPGPGGDSPDAKLPDGALPDGGSQDGSVVTRDAGEDAGTTPDGQVTPPDAMVPDATPDAQMGDYGPAEGILISEFDDNVEAAFDDVTVQTAANAATTTLFPVVTGDVFMGRDWTCSARIDRVEVHGPSNGSFLANGGTGKVQVLGRGVSHDTRWTVIAEKAFGSDNPSKPVVFDSSDFNGASLETSHAVGFLTDGGTSTLRIAEVVIEASCIFPQDTIEWVTSPWICDAECVNESNSGVQERTVRCLRNADKVANVAHCDDAMPPEVGGACTLQCPYDLLFVGYREFTYSNMSGWLHEGRVGSRAGPLPSAVEFGTTRAAIEGKPCSEQTTTPSTYYVGISCKDPDMPDSGEYCAFRCEQP